MSEVITTLNTRIGKKSAAIASDDAKVANLQKQIDMYQSSIERTELSRDKKREEVEELLDLLAEAEPLVKERDELLAYTEGLRAKFDAIEWRPDQPWEEKIESTDYQEKVDERHAINARLVEIEKAANKIYYRR